MRSNLAFSSLLVVLTCSIYWQVYDFDFVNLDDGRYVYRNDRMEDGLSGENVRWAFTTFYFANWIPLTWLSYFADVEVWGLKAGGFHVTNLVLHLANTVLVFQVLRAFTGAPLRSFFVALIFSVHPMHVESVAWISERKGLLGAFFLLTALLAYRRYASRPRIAMYVLTFSLFMASLMSKPSAVTFPFLLLLLDLWPLRRWQQDREGRSIAFRWRVLVLEKIPYLIGSVAISVVAVMAQRSGGALRTLEEFSPVERLQNVPISFGLYLLRFFWPMHLAAFYQNQMEEVFVRGAAVLSAVVVCAVTVVGVVWIRRRPYVFVGWGWFLGTLVPMVGIVQVGNQLTADRYTYIPYIGLLVAVVWLVGEGVRDRRRLGVAVTAGASVWAAALMPISWDQIGVWRDSATMNERIHRVNFSDTFIASEYFTAGEYELAITHFKRALKKRPEDVVVHEGLGLSYEKLDNDPEAERYYRSGLDIDPDYGRLYGRLGEISLRREAFAEAEALFRESLRLEPGTPRPMKLLGTALVNQGRYGEAEIWLRGAVHKGERDANTLNNFAASLMARGQWREAFDILQEAARVAPDDATIQLNRAIARFELGFVDDARAITQTALELDPEYEKASAFLAYLDRREATSRRTDAPAREPETSGREESPAEEKDGEI